MLRRAAGWLVLSLVCLVGCSDDKMATVTGKVTIDGTPIAKGSIMFKPVDGKSSTTGGEIVEGEYKVEVPYGVQSVEIRSPKVVGKKKLYDTPDSPVQDLLDEVLPPRYNNETELQVTVEKGKTDPVNFELTLKKKK
ncbi:MAG: hypothetical protein U0795_05855 [Pirellulales bacterium]